jgi:RHS repeat-associated protein
VATFVYDALGRRVQKVAGGVTRLYVYDHEDIVEERAGADVIRYVHGPGIDDVLAGTTNGADVTYYLADHLGSVVQETNASAQVVLTREYDPWGLPLQGGAVSGFGFTGREWDAESQLHFYRARHYEPRLGRFISTDPIGLLGGINLQAYATNQPVNLIDPSGLDPEGLWHAAKGAASSAVQSASSIYNSAVGILTGNWQRVAESYETGPLGQTESGPSWAFWGTRGGLVVAGSAAGAACILGSGGSTLGLTRVGWKGGEITLTRSGATTPGFRINPFGGSGYPPHYHRRGPGGIGKHRPWQGGKGRW